MQSTYLLAQTLVVRKTRVMRNEVFMIVVEIVISCGGVKDGRR